MNYVDMDRYFSLVPGGDGLRYASFGLIVDERLVYNFTECAYRLESIAAASNTMEERTVFAIEMWSNSRGDPRLVDIYALWWNSTRSQTYAPLALNGIPKSIAD